jgi:dienelactone hydrolase
LIIGITSWRICGPFVVDGQDQRYSPSSEARMFDKDYLKAAGGSEAPLKLPSRVTDAQINFQRDNAKEPRASSAPVFLNQTQEFPTPSVDSQILFWGAYHVFKIIYAAAELASSTDQDLVLLSAPTNSPIKIWVNNAVQTQSPPGSVGARDVGYVGAKVHLRAGRNTLLVKLICFPLGNCFGIWIATPDRAYQFIEEQGGVFDVLTQVAIPRGGVLRIAPIVGIYDESPRREGRYEIRDVAGRIAASGHLAAAADAGIKSSALSDGLYSISVEKGTLTTGELFFVGDLKKRLAIYARQCAAETAGDLPCEALPILIQTSEADGAGFRLEHQTLMVFLMAQFEWALQGISPKTIFPDHAPRVRLTSFRSNIDGSIQPYCLYLPPDVQSGQPLPLVVVAPINAVPGMTFFNYNTMYASMLLARFADRYHVSFIAPFGRGEQMPSDLAEEDILEAIQDAKARFRVDDSRIYLAGVCVGGRNAFLMAEDHPEVFSAISTRVAMTGLSSTVTNSELDSRNPLIRLRNLSSMPIGLAHGEVDYHSPTSQARLFMQEAQKVGVFPQLTMLPINELVNGDRKMLEFFATVKKRDPAIPHHVALAVTELKHNHAFWIQVDELRATNGPGYISGDIDAQNRINITSTNIQRVTIDTLRLPSGLVRRQPWVVVCNGGQEQRLLPDKLGRIVPKIVEVPQADEPKEHKEIALDPKLLDGYVGQYQLAPKVLTITREGDKLLGQFTGQPKIQIFPESQRDFFLKVVDAQITFETDANGRATSLTLHQKGHNIPAKRIEGEGASAPAPKEHKEITVDPKLFDGYVGQYQLGPNFILTITRESNQLYAQATNQPKVPIFPEGQRDFFLKVVDEQITFETDANGRATSLTLYQNGANMPAERVQ